jgi:hypothetical protein
LKYITIFIARGQRNTVKQLLNKASLYAQKYLAHFNVPKHERPTRLNKFQQLSPKNFFNATHSIKTSKRSTFVTEKSYKLTATRAKVIKNPIILFFNIFFLSNLAGLDRRLKIHHRFHFHTVSSIGSLSAVMNATVFFLTSELRRSLFSLIFSIINKLL